MHYRQKLVVVSMNNTQSINSYTAIEFVFTFKPFILWSKILSCHEIFFYFQAFLFYNQKYILAIKFYLQAFLFNAQKCIPAIRFVLKRGNLKLTQKFSWIFLKNIYKEFIRNSLFKFGIIESYEKKNEL